MKSIKSISSLLICTLTILIFSAMPAWAADSIDMDDLDESTQEIITEEETSITVVKGQHFNIIVQGHIDLEEGQEFGSGNVMVIYKNTEYNYIILSGALYERGVKNIEIDGHNFIFNVIDPPKTEVYTLSI